MINLLNKIFQFSELIKCSNDPVYFINNYVKFSSFEEANAPFLLYPAQEEIVKKIHKNKYNLIKAQDNLVNHLFHYFTFYIKQFLNLIAIL